MTAGRTAAVTGLGAVTGFGFGVDAFWSGLLRGETSIESFGDPDLFDPAAHRTQVASAVDIRAHRSLSRADQFARAAAREAADQAWGAGAAAPAGLGVFFGSSTGALLETEQAMDRFLDRIRPIPTRILGSQQHNGPGDAAARLLGATGPVVSVSSACASSTMAIGMALDAIRSGEVDVAIAGGSDELSQLTYAGFNALRAVDHQPTRPFRADRGGLSLGEGAGVVVLESEEHARSRGAEVLAYLAGTSSTCDAHHMSAPLGDGSGAARAMQQAIVDAGITEDQVDFLNVHGTGTPQNDAAEWQAIQTVFGTRSTRVPVTATKSLTGHLLGASGGVEAVATVLCLCHGVLPGAPGGGALDPDFQLDLVLGPPRLAPRLRAGLSTNLAFGGANSVLALVAATPHEGEA